MSLYIDASALMPLLVEERASRPVSDLLGATPQPMVVSEFAAVEVASAMARLVRMNLVTAQAADDLLAKFDAWRTVATRSADLSGAPHRSAGLYVRRFDLGLRAPDALHIALCRRDGHELVTLDKRLARAARALGVGVEPLE